MARLKIAVVAPSLRILGGQSVQAERLLQAWRSDPDVEAWLVPIDPPPPAWLRFTRSIKYVRTAVTQLTYAPSLVRAIRQADVVHVFSASYASFLLAPLPAIVAARAAGKPVVLNYHSGEAPDHLARSRTARIVLRHTACNVVPSSFLVNVFAQFGLGAVAVPNTIDLDRFPFRTRSGRATRLLSTRNFEDNYNVACTLRAFRLVQHRCPSASLTLVGGGAHESRLRTLASELNLRNVTFAGRLPPDAIAEVCAAHDLFVQSPDVDNMPLSVLEAFASGLPVVSTRAGGVPSILEHGVHGLLAPVGDHTALADHVLTLMARPSLAARLAAAARASCEAYTWGSVRPQWLRVYRSVVRPPAPESLVAAASCRD
jgi:L-malate glycosyltransferase